MLLLLIIALIVFLATRSLLLTLITILLLYFALYHTTVHVIQFEAGVAYSEPYTTVDTKTVEMPQQIKVIKTLTY